MVDVVETRVSPRDIERLALVDGKLITVVRAKSNEDARRRRITTWNEDPKPFAWTKTADEILDQLASYIQLIPGAGR